MHFFECYLLHFLQVQHWIYQSSHKLFVLNFTYFFLKNSNLWLPFLLLCVSKKSWPLVFYFFYLYKFIFTILQNLQINSTITLKDQDSRITIHDSFSSFHIPQLWNYHSILCYNFLSIFRSFLALLLSFRQWFHFLFFWS